MRHALRKIEWVKPPRQVRSQENLERILDAAEEVLSEKGFEQATIAEIVGRAQTSVGAFYSRFREKDALIGCLHQRFCEEAMVTTATVLDPERWEGASVWEILAETVPFLVEVYRQRRGLIRAFVLRGSTDPEFASQWLHLSNFVAAELTELILARRQELTHPDPPVAIALGLQVLLGTLDQTTLLDPVGRPGLSLDSERLPLELTRLFASYLGLDSTRFAEE